MSIETWGQMDKSQIDSEKVEEAIARLISAHETDPTAHMGVGEAIEAHRTAEILDHKAGSIVADKQSLSELAMVSDMNPANGWDTDHFNFYFPQVYAGFSHDGYVSAYIENGNVQWKLKENGDLKDNMFQIGFQYNASENDIGILYGGMGVTENPENEYGVGFKIENGSISFIAEFGDMQDWSSSSALSQSQNHLITAWLDSSLGDVVFYVDGTELFRRHLPTLEDWSFGVFNITARRNYNPASGHGFNFYFGPLKIVNSTL